MLTMTARPGLATLVDAIRVQTERGLSARRTSHAVADVLRADLPGVDILTEQERVGSATELVGIVLHAEETFSIKALVWRPGQQTPIHDHIAWCTFGVLQGTEFEILYRDEGDHLVEIGRNAGGVGEVSGFAPPGDIHKVHNIGDQTAISLHVYGADLSKDGNSVRREYHLPVRDRAA